MLFGVVLIFVNSVIILRFYFAGILVWAWVEFGLNLNNRDRYIFFVLWCFMFFCTEIVDMLFDVVACKIEWV